MKGIACPMPGSLEPLVEHATKLGVPNPVFETTRAYLAFNEARNKAGLDPVTPSVQEVDEIFRGWFKLDTTVKPVDTNVSPETAEILQQFDLTAVFSEYEVLRRPITLSFPEQKTLKVGARVATLLDQLSSNLGIAYELVTPETARELTKDVNQWNGQPGFFLGNRVYIVADSITEDTVFHEFAHPFIRAIKIGNPELYDKLAGDLLNTSKGRSLYVKAQEGYPDPKDPIILEEALVMALTESAVNREDSAFNSFIKDLLFAIKQILRKVFGKDNKVTIENLKSDTTLDELADMLVLDSFDLDIDAISREDLAAYMSDTSKLTKELLSLDKSRLQESTDEMFNVITEQIRKIEKKGEYKTLANILKDAYNRSDLDEIRSNLAAYQTVSPEFISEINKLKDDVLYAQKHVQAFLQSLERMKKMSVKMSEVIGKMVSEPLTKDSIATVFYYNNILTSWEVFMDNFGTILNEAVQNNEIDRNNDIFALTGSIEEQIKNSKKLTTKIYEEGVSQIIMETVAPMKQRIDEKFKAIMDDVEKRQLGEKVKRIRMSDYYGLKGEELDAFLNFKARIDNGEVLKGVEAQNYEMLKLLSFKNGAYITDEKIKYLMSGALGDAHATNSFLEGYIYNQDLVVSNFALWVKNQMTDVYTHAMTLGNEFVKDIQPLLERAGYNQGNPAEFFRKITFLDQRSYRENGVTKEYLVHSFLNPHKNYRKALTDMDEEILQADQKALQTGDKTESLRLRVKRDEFMRTFFSTPYTKEYYERYKIFRKLGENDEIGIEAEALRKDKIDAIRLRTTMLEKGNDDENRQTLQDLDELYRSYRYLFSHYNERGDLKTDREIQIADRLREYRDASRDLFREELIPNIFEDTIKAYEDELVAQGLPRGTQGFKDMRAAFINKHTRVKIDQSYYTHLANLYAEIELIESKMNNAQLKTTIGNLRKKLSDMMAPYKDEDLQVEGSAMNTIKVKEIKALEEEIYELEQQQVKASGLTKNEYRQLQVLYAKMKAKQKLSDDEQDLFEDLIQKREDDGLEKQDRDKLKSLYKEISEMSETSPTIYYLDIMDHFLGTMSEETSNLYFEKYGQKNAELTMSDIYLTKEFYDEIVSPNKRFKDWYDKNHLFREETDQLGNKKTAVKRVKIWNVTRPASLAYYATHSFINSDGKKEVVRGVPLSRYYKKIVKDQYVTKQVTMEEALEMGDPSLATIDNKGNALPKMDAPDNRFINEQFFELKKDQAKYTALLALMKWSLKFQEGKEDTSKLYLDVPRFLISKYEIVRNPDENPISRFWKNVRRFFWSQDDEDKFDRGFNYQEQLMLMPGDLFDDASSGVPIQGLSRLDNTEVSLDVISGMLRYALSAEKQKALIKMLPTARALQTVLHDPNNFSSIQKKLTKFQQKNRSISKTYDSLIKWKQPHKERSVRQKAIDNFIEREFEGKINKGAIGTDSESMRLQKMAEAIMKRSAFGYFALDIPSALKNDFSLRIQSLIEAAGGKYFNHASLSKGTLWANNATWDISMNVYSDKTKPHNEQLVMLFDAFQGRFDDKFDDSMSRSFVKDAIGGLSWMTSFRKWTELNSTLAIFGAMLYHEKNVTRVVNGEETKINYMDAWETVDGQIKLKEGVDPEWGQEGAKFKQFRNRVHGVVNNLAGSFAKFDYAEADRYFAYRFAIAFKRWFTRMFLNRFQYRGKMLGTKQHRYDSAVGDTAMGYYVEGLQYLFRSIKGGGDYYRSITDDEKSAVIRVLADVGYTVLFMMAISLLFDFDPDDEDKFKKLREKSGPLPFPFVPEGQGDFKFGGWMSNQGLYMAMQLKNEQTQWLPLPGIGADIYIDMLKLDSVAMHNTWDNYKKIGVGLATHAGNKIFGMDDSKAYFDQREGPYDWMQEDGSKVMTYITRSLGLTGKSVDPAMAITNFIKGQNWR